ncbi:ferric iron siderophore receptor [Komagataeibacter xylinus NBRC 15237]|nr:TonB-dependent receptor [Komagataeibacter xylinus]GBQ70575.1 ferric iron siderophore receptor [Komagataeibacter xylinus NBRC 15237]
MQFPVEGTLYPGPYGRIPRSRFVGSTNFNQQSDRDAMFEYQFQHRFSRFLNFSQVFRYEKSKSYDRDMYMSGMINDRQATLTPWISDGYNGTTGLDSRFYEKFKIGNVENTWVVGSDFRQYNYHSNITFDDAQYTTDLYNPPNNYRPCTSPRSPECTVWQTTSTNQYFQEGVYFQDQIKWKGLSLLLGGRQDWVDETTHGESITNENAAHETTYTAHVRSVRPESAFTWRVGLIYQFDFGLAPYFSYATSFIPQTGSDWLGNPFPSLTGQQKEAGLKYKVPNRDILITASAYDINENHYLISDYAHPNYSADAGRVNARGFEVAANANITRDLRLVASYSYNSMTYAKTNLTAATQLPDGSYGPTASEKGKYVESVPRNMFSFFLDYKLPGKIMPRFSVNGGMRYIGFTYSDAVNTFKVPAYYLFDIGMHYDFSEKIPMLKGLQAQLAVSNLTNRYYVTSCGGNFACYVGQGRRVYGSLSYSW